MARMTREFSLVLLGAGMLTAGSFLWPEEDLENIAKKEANRQVATTTNTTGRSYYRPIIFFHGMGMGGAGGATSSPARVSFNRGGFGGTGAHISGIS